MDKQKIRTILPIAFMILSIVGMIYFGINVAKDRNVNETLYEKAHLTVEDLKIESTHAGVTTMEVEGEDFVEFKAKKLYGIEYVVTYKLDEDEGIEATFLHGDPAKILILDENGNERFYREVSELSFEPGKAGKYDVYLVGKKFTGRITFSTY